MSTVELGWFVLTGAVLFCAGHAAGYGRGKQDAIRHIRSIIGRNHDHG